MKTRGGYNIRLKGKPSKGLIALKEPTILLLPLKTRRFSFTEIHVKDAERVVQGAVLASDPETQNLPLIAPRGGTVRLSHTPGHITIENPEPEAAKAENRWPSLYEIPEGAEQKERITRSLLRKGAWQFFTDAFTGRVPDPAVAPQAVVISTVNLEPFSVRGDAQLEARLQDFLRGIEQLQPLLEYQPVWMVFPIFRSELGVKIREFARGKAWIQLHEIPRIYPFDNERLLAKSLGLKAKDGPVWSVKTEGIIAVNTALTYSMPATNRIFAVGGPSVAKPSHMVAIPGYPVDSLMEQVGLTEASRLINGGAFTGTEIGEANRGLDSESLCITALPVAYKREVLSFVLPGFQKRSYTNTFASLIRPKFKERITTALRGEKRPCINCGFCSEVCPAGIVPSAIHKAVFANDFENYDKLRPELCVECGLCSYVCTSKIDLRQEIIEVKETIRKEAELLQEGATE
jgi:Na(+)-translocating NADH:ubiquinone oxidoreductase A subunit